MPNGRPDLAGKLNLLPQYDALGTTRPLGPGEYVTNSDGSWSNEYSGTVQLGDKWSVVPTLWLRNGKPAILSEDEAAATASKSGLNFPNFPTEQAAEAFSQAREAQWQKTPVGRSDMQPPLWTKQQMPDDTQGSGPPPPPGVTLVPLQRNQQQRTGPPPPPGVTLTPGNGAAGAPAREPPDTSGWTALWHSLLRGGRDILEGGAQIGARMGPEAPQFAEPGAREDLTRRVDEAARQSEAAYQQDPAVSRHGLISGLGRIGGNIAATAPLMAVPGLGFGGAATRTGAGLLARGALSGAAGGAMQPVLQTDDYWTEKGKQAGWGAAVGAAIPAAGSMISPRLPSPGLVTPGTKAGGIVLDQGFSRAFRPLYNFFTGAEERTNNGFDRTIARQVLDPIGGRIDGRLSGHELLNKTYDQISDAYDRVLPNITLRNNAVIGHVDQDLDDFVATMSSDHRARFNELVKRQIDGRFDQNGMMDGQTFKRAQSDLSKRAWSWLGTNDDELGRAVMMKLDGLNEIVKDTNPQWAPQLQRANESYRLWARMRQAAANPKKEGVFTPDDLLTAIGKQEKGRTWSGDRPLQGYAVAARSAMGKRPAGLRDLMALFHRHGIIGSVVGETAGPLARGAKAATPLAAPAAGEFIGREMRLPPSPEQRQRDRLKAAQRVGELSTQRYQANRRGDVTEFAELGKKLAAAHRDYRELGGTA